MGLSASPQIDKNFAANDTEYFFTLLGPRFDAVVPLMAASLERRFQKRFKPIYVLSARPSSAFRENYLVLNGRAATIASQTKQPVVYLQEYEDLNDEFVRSEAVRTIATQLLRKQDRLFLYPFTTSFLAPDNPRWIVIGPKTEIATQFDNKINQYELFTLLDLPRNQARVFTNLDGLRTAAPALLPFYVTAAYTSGGNESGLTFTTDLLERYLGRLRDVNLSNRFLVAKIFQRVVNAPNATALVADRNVVVHLALSDQILRGTRYLGNVYPSKATTSQRRIINACMNKIGAYLAKQGFRGLFGCDFLINDRGKVVIVDLNPRRQGGYGCIALSLESLEISLTDLELACALDGHVESLPTAEQLYYPRSWAHSKAKPYEAGVTITKEIETGNLTDIFKRGGEYRRSFYQTGSLFIEGYVGYVAKVAADRKAVENWILAQPDLFLKDVLT